MPLVVKYFNEYFKSLCRLKFLEQAEYVMGENIERVFWTRFHQNLVLGAHLQNPTFLGTSSCWE